MMPNQINTDRLLIRPRTSRDLNACLAMDRDPMVTKYIAGPWHDPEAHTAFLKERMAATYPYPLGYWTISFIEQSDSFLGWVMMLPTDTSNTKVEIGWRLTHETWGKGIATEAIKACVSLLRKHFPDIKMIASIHSDNLGSIKVAEKIGMSFTHEKAVDGVKEKLFAF